VDEIRFGRYVFAWQAGLAGVGAVAWLLLRGSSFAISFLLGAAGACGSFWLLHRAVLSLTPGEKPGWAAVAATFRLVLTGAFFFAILRSYELQRGAAATGILVVVTSILLEVIREHLHGT
jgi:ATP synthase I chain